MYSIYTHDDDNSNIIVYRATTCISECICIVRCRFGVGFFGSGTHLCPTSALKGVLCEVLTEDQSMMALMTPDRWDDPRSDTKISNECRVGEHLS